MAVISTTSADQAALVGRAVAAWCERWAPASVLLDELGAKAFPTEVVAGHWLANGRLRAGPEAVQAAGHAAALLDGKAADAPSATWLLSNWLPMLVDVHRGTLTYASYVGVHPLNQLAAVYGQGPVVAALLADLLQHETKRPTAPGEPVTAIVLRRRRLFAVASALVQHRPADVDRTLLTSVWPVRRQTSGAGPLERELLSATSRVAERVAAVIPRRLSDVVRVLVVPVTDVADEVMFLRVLQLFEVVFAGMARSLTAGRDALERGDEDTATTEIRQAATTLTRAIPFFRILGTMSAESFARIRTMTPGASGLQSDSFKQIELTCSRQTPDRMGLLGYTEPNIVDLAAKEEGRPTIEELVEAGPPPPALLEGMVKLDKEWAQWKRTYWAIAVRLIGDSPGTGGTAGAAYPRHHVAGPLFPMLHG